MKSNSNSKVLRIKIRKNDQRRLFKKLKGKLRSRKQCLKLLNISEGAYKNYASTKTRYVPKRIIEIVSHFLKESLPKILETKTLKEIRQKTIKKTYPALKRKYGKTWEKEIAKKGHKTLQKKYGKNWKKIIAVKGHQTSKKIYGKNFQKVIWEKAIERLKIKFGENWPKEIAKKGHKKLQKKYGKDWKKKVMENARKGHVKKYGKDWPRILSKKGDKRLKEKYGENYRPEIGKKGVWKRSWKSTKQEKMICQQLRNENIPFETHCIKNGREYDIIIPNLANPKIVIECSNMKPSKPIEWIKILQLLKQKENFSEATHVAIFNRDYKQLTFKQHVYEYFVDQGIVVLFDEDIELITKKIREYLEGENEDLLYYRYHHFDKLKKKNRSLSAALSNKNKLNKEERKIKNILKGLNIKSESQRILQTKYNNAVVFDNFEKDTNICYEVTSGKSYINLSSLVGKIAYIKSIEANLKFIVILTEKETLADTELDGSLTKYADAIILKRQFNKRGVIKARGGITKN